MNIFMVLNIGLLAILVYCGAKAAQLVRPLNLFSMPGAKEEAHEAENDLRSKKHLAGAVWAGVITVLFLSLVITISANPEWFAQLDKVLQPIADWLGEILASASPKAVRAALFSALLLMLSLSFHQDLKRMRVLWKICLGSSIVGVVVLLTVINNWVSYSLLAALLAVITSMSLQPRVSFLKLVLVMAIVAFTYDLVQVFFTNQMMEVAENSIPPLPGTETQTQQVSLHPPSIFVLPDNWSMTPTGFTMLGAGDVCVGIILAASAARIGKQIKSKLPLIMSVVGFAVSLLVTMTVAIFFEFAQPALIYIVPIVSIFVIGTLYAMKRPEELKRKPWPRQVLSMQAEEEPATSVNA